MGGLRNANAAWVGQSLQTGGYIDSIPENVAALEHHITDMHSDPKPETALVGDVLISLRESLLHLSRTLDSLDGAREFGQ
jgi:hypothetical protein